MKMSPEELCGVMKCQFQGTSEKGCQASPDCLALVHAEAVQEALLSKLQGTKIEGCEESIARVIGEEHYRDDFHGAYVTERDRQRCREIARCVVSLITPFLAAQIEAAEKAGMEKVAKWMTKPCEHSGAGFYRMKEHRHCTRCLTAFRKEHGLLGGKAVQYPQEGINEQ